MARFCQGCSVVTYLSLSTALTLVLASLVMYPIFGISLFRVLDGKLQAETTDLAESLSEALQTHIWNMDGDTIRDFIESYPKPRGMERLRIASEFGDLIYEMPEGGDPDVLVHVHNVNRDGVLIGTITISVSRRDIRLVQRAAAYASLLILAAGVGIVFITMLLGQRYVLGRGLTRLLNGIEKISHGDYSHRLHDATCREFTELNSHVNRMAQQIDERTENLKGEIVQRENAERQLRQLAESLEVKVEDRTRELVQTNDLLEQEIMERRKVQSEILKISGREQQRLGRDLHDSLGQQLVGISYLSKSLAKKLEAFAPNDALLAARISELVRDSVAQTRQMAHGLCPVGILESGIKDALEELACSVEGLFDIRCKMFCDDDVWLDADAATHLYRIAQEAVSNACRHGNAQNIRIELRGVDDTLHFTITDDGEGMAASSPTGEGIGIRIMQYRAEAVSGTLTFSAGDDGRGVRINIVFPRPQRPKTLSG